MKPNQNSDTPGRWRTWLSLALSLLALCTAVLAVCVSLGLFDEAQPDPPAPTQSPTATPTPLPTGTQEPTPTETPTETPDRTETLRKLGVPTENLTPEMAKAYAALIRAETQPVVRAAIFDGGGMPMLWLAHGASAENFEDREALEGPYGDRVYGYQDGRVLECPWITSLLREGDQAVVAQVWLDYVSDLQDDFRLYRMENGSLAKEPFASGTVGINGATLNGQPVGGAEEFLTLEAVYKLLDPELEILLNADSGLADLLFLSGRYTWLEGAELAEALEAYGG